MAKFISFDVAGNSNNYENNTQLINAEKIISIEQASQSEVFIHLEAGDISDKIIIKLSKSKTSFVSPVLTSNLGARAFNNVVAGKPGVRRSYLNLGKDSNGDQMYINKVTYS